MSDDDAFKDFSNAQLRAILGEKLVDPEVDLRGIANRNRREWNEFTEDMHEMFLQTLAQTGMYSRAAHSIGCKYVAVKDYRLNHPEFQERCNEALEVYRNSFILEAQRRAVHGVRNPIIGGRNKDQVVGTEIKYSDNLLALFLKRGQDGSFTERQEIKHTGQVDIRERMDIRSLSKKARKMLRALLEQMELDHANKALGIEEDNSDIPDVFEEDPK